MIDIFVDNAVFENPISELVPNIIEHLADGRSMTIATPTLVQTALVIAGAIADNNEESRIFLDLERADGDTVYLVVPDAAHARAFGSYLRPCHQVVPYVKVVTSEEMLEGILNHSEPEWEGTIILVNSLDTSVVQSILRAELVDLSIPFISITPDAVFEVRSADEDRRCVSDVEYAFDHDDVVHRPSFSPIEAIRHLREEHHCESIALVMTNRGDAERVADDVSAFIQNELGLSEMEFSITMIHAGTADKFAYYTGEQGELPTLLDVYITTDMFATAFSPGVFDGMVLSGRTMVEHRRGGHVYDRADDLTLSEINRLVWAGSSEDTTPVVVLLGETPLENRRCHREDALYRLPLDTVVMDHAAWNVTLHPSLQYPQNTILEKMVSRNDEGVLALTDLGDLAYSLPCNYEYAELMWWAVNSERLPQLIPLVAMLQMGDLRAIFNQPINCDVWTYSDVANQLAVVAIIYERAMRNFKRLAQICAEYNISQHKYETYLRIVHRLEQHVKCQANIAFYHPEYNTSHYQLERMIKNIMFGLQKNTRADYNMQRQRVEVDGKYISLTRTSACRKHDDPQILFATGKHNLIVPANSPAFTVLEWVTLYNRDDAIDLSRSYDWDDIDPDKRLQYTASDVKSPAVSGTMASALMEAMSR